MTDAENFGSKLPQPTRYGLPSPQKPLLEMNSAATNSRTAMPPPNITAGHKRQGSALPEPASKQRRTLAERAGETRPSNPAAPKSSAPLNPAVMSTVQSQNPTAFSKSYRSNSAVSRDTSASSTSTTNFSMSVGSGIRPPAVRAPSNLSTRSHSSLARPRGGKAPAVSRPPTAQGARAGGKDDDGPNGKSSWNPEEQYSNMERMYREVCQHYTEMASDNAEAKEINDTHKSRIERLEQEQRDSTQTIFDLRLQIESATFKLEAAERSKQEKEQTHSDKVEDIRRQNRIDQESLHQRHSDDFERLRTEHREELRELKKRLEDEVEIERTQRIQALSQVSTQGALEKQRHQMDLDAKDHEIRTCHIDIERLKTDVEREKLLNEEARQRLSAAGDSASQMENARLALQAKIDYLESDSKSQSEAYATMERRMNEAIAEAGEATEKLRKEEMLRRKLHNQVQELKGNIRVFCRVRPTNGSDKAEETAKITFPDDEEELKDIEVKGAEETNSLGKVTTKTHAFSFDRVFDPSSNNTQIFDEISQLIQSALDGYNVCIFAYGQTGSGKTYTMSSEDGMIPRALRQIYATSKELESRGWKYTMEGSFVEVYNEDIRDLLSTKDLENGKKHQIIHDAVNCETSITEVTTLNLNSQDQVEGILARAMSRRSVAATKANERSSRSHSVFILKLTGHNTITGKKSKGTLNLVDLAGSERLTHSKVEGARLKETQNINKSLSCLGDVIGALGQQQSSTPHTSSSSSSSKSQSRESSPNRPSTTAGSTGHIPYRNSKLTYLLQYSLGGNSKTLMFVMVAPEKKCLAETITSLKFADKVSRTRIGVARKAR